MINVIEYIENNDLQSEMLDYIVKNDNQLFLAIKKYEVCARMDGVDLDYIFQTDVEDYFFGNYENTDQEEVKNILERAGVLYLQVLTYLAVKDIKKDVEKHGIEWYIVAQTYN